MRRLSMIRIITASVIVVGVFTSNKIAIKEPVVKIPDREIASADSNYKEKINTALSLSTSKFNSLDEISAAVQKIDEVKTIDSENQLTQMYLNLIGNSLNFFITRFSVSIKVGNRANDIYEWLQFKKLISQSIDKKCDQEVLSSISQVSEKERTNICELYYDLEPFVKEQLGAEQDIADSAKSPDLISQEKQEFELNKQDAVSLDPDSALGIYKENLQKMKKTFIYLNSRVRFTKKK